MSNLKLSIIVLNYRSWELISNCINSIIKHSPKISYEIIVIDNDSQDGSFESFSNKYNDIQCIKNIGNFGYSSGCNLGAKYANGEYLLFLNPDVEVTSSPAIDTMIEYADTHKNTGIISCKKIKPGNKIEREVTFINPWLTLGVARSLYKKTFKNKINKQLPNNADIWHPEWLTGSIFFISYNVFEQVGGLPEKDYWMYFEEMDLAYRIKDIGKTITLIRNVEVKHQHGGSSRINPSTSAITKSEVMISRHVYIQKFSSGLNCFLLHSSMLLISLSSKLVMAVASLPFFWTKKAQASLLLFIKSLQYYFSVPFRKTWKSKRLPNG